MPELCYNQPNATEPLPAAGLGQAAFPVATRHLVARSQGMCSQGMCSISEIAGAQHSQALRHSFAQPAGTLPVSQRNYGWSLSYNTATYGTFSQYWFERLPHYPCYPYDLRPQRSISALYMESIAFECRIMHTHADLLGLAGTHSTLRNWRATRTFHASSHVLMQ